MRFDRRARAHLMVIYVNCWRWGVESEAMWKLYCGSETEGIAVRSTFCKLRETISDPHTVVSLIHYFDYATGNFLRRRYVYDPALHKRQAFESEQEVRILRYDPADWNSIVFNPDFTAPDHCEIAWRPEDAIEAIIVHPKSPPAFYDTVRREVSSRNGHVGSLVSLSPLSAKPVY